MATTTTTTTTSAGPTAERASEPIEPACPMCQSERAMLLGALGATADDLTVTWWLRCRHCGYDYPGGHNA
jgi:DNA-directed RNA polymerase subunit M/transcription elongation factor TFIIS